MAPLTTLTALTPANFNKGPLMKLLYTFKAIELHGALTFIKMEVGADPDSAANEIGLPLIEISLPRRRVDGPLDEAIQEALAFARKFLNESVLEDWLLAQQKKD